MLLKWNMQRGVPVIPKATSREHLAENFVDMFNWRLTNQQKVSNVKDTVVCAVLRCCCLVHGLYPEHNRLTVASAQ